MRGPGCGEPGRIRDRPALRGESNIFCLTAQIISENMRLRILIGVLVQDRVTFAAPGGPPQPRVSPRDVADLYHTGGAFDARGLARPFSRIVYRIGEIGDPQIRVQDKTVALKAAAGFGGRMILTATRPALHEIIFRR